MIFDSDLVEKFSFNYTSSRQFAVVIGAVGLSTDWLFNILMISLINSSGDGRYIDLRVPKKSYHI